MSITNANASLPAGSMNAQPGAVGALLTTDETINHPAGHRAQAAACADNLIQMARALRQQSTVQDTLYAIGSYAMMMISGGKWFSIMVRLPDGRRAGQAHSDDIAARAAAILTSHQTGGTHHDRAVVATNQYDRPEPATMKRLITETAVRDLAQFRLPIAGTEIGTLIIYSDRPDCLPQATSRELEDLLILAGLAVDAAVDRDQVIQLRLALTSNRTIGAAIGILMSTRRITEDQAFQLLRAASQNTHRKLREIAEDVLYAGDLSSSMAI